MTLFWTIRCTCYLYLKVEERTISSSQKALRVWGDSWSSPLFRQFHIFPFGPSFSCRSISRPLLSGVTGPAFSHPAFCQYLVRHYTRVAMLALYLLLSRVCPSVCLSVTSQNCTKTQNVKSCKQRCTI